MDGSESGVVWTCVSDDINWVDDIVTNAVAEEGVIVEDVVVVVEGVA